MAKGGLCGEGGEHGEGGHAWLRGHACQRGVHGEGGHVFQRWACMGYDEIQSMSGWHTSYWNAFLFEKDSCTARISFLINFVFDKKGNSILIVFDKMFIYPHMIVCHVFQVSSHVLSDSSENELTRLGRFNRPTW